MLSDPSFMEIAQVLAKSGTCSRLQVGALLVRDRRIISTGYNGAPRGMPHCDHSDRARTVTEYEAGIIHPAKGCAVAVHAEANAIAFAARYGIATAAASMYTTDSPCVKCAELIINAGIIEVIYGREYRISTGVDLLLQARVHVARLDGSTLHRVFSARGYGESVHSREPSDPAFDAGWQAAADDRNR